MKKPPASAIVSDLTYDAINNRLDEIALRAVEVRDHAQSVYDAISTLRRDITNTMIADAMRQAK